MVHGGTISRTELLDRLVRLVEAVELDHPARVAVDGPDAVGKTTLADELAAVLRDSGRQVIRASVDDFQRPRAERYARGADSPHGYYLDAFDYDALRSSLLEPLGPGGNRVFRTAVFDYLTDAPLVQAPAVASERAVLVVDGVFLLRPELRDAWDVSVFVTAGFEETIRRARQRDLRVLGSAEEIERRYRTRYLPGQELYFAEAQPEQVADAVIVNDDPTAPLVHLR